MLQKIKILILAAAFLFLPMASVAVAGVVRAQEPNIQANLCQGTDKLQIDPVTGTATCVSQLRAETCDFNCILQRVVNILSIIVGIIAVIMIIIGGFRYIISGGSAEKVTAAKNTILYGLVGLIIVALAQVIVRFVLRQTTTGSGGTP